MNLRHYYRVVSRILFVSIFACLSSHTSAQPVEIPDAAKNKWYVDEAENLCFMSHAINGGSNRRLTVQAYPGSQLYDIVLESDVWPVKNLRLNYSGLELKPLPGQHRPKTYVEPSMSASGRALRLVELQSSILLDLSKAAVLELTDLKFKLSYPVPAGAAAAIKALVDCQITKMIDWGADPSGFGPGASPVKVLGEPRSWFGFQFFDKPKSYRVAVRTIVNPQGRAERCDFLRSSVSQKEQDSACSAILERAQFEPARNAKGVPVRSVYVIHANLVRYRMFQDLPED